MDSLRGLGYDFLAFLSNNVLAIFLTFCLYMLTSASQFTDLMSCDFHNIRKYFAKEDQR